MTNAGTVTERRRRAPGELSRRTAVRAAAVALAGLGAPRAWGHPGSSGPVTPPLPCPAVPLTLDDGAQIAMPRLLQGRMTAVQLMFTACTATCPLQGALFAAVARKLKDGSGGKRPVQLLSISIDPGTDTPAALRAWVKRFGGQAPSWRAAAPRPEDVDRLFDHFRGRAAGSDRHTTQVHLIDERARLVLRSVPMPTADQVVALLTSSS